MDDIMTDNDDSDSGSEVESDSDPQSTSETKAILDLKHDHSSSNLQPLQSRAAEPQSRKFHKTGKLSNKSHTNPSALTAHAQPVPNDMTHSHPFVSIPPSVSVPPPPDSDCIVKCAEYLKRRYKRMSALPTPKWPPSVNEPVKLALIEKERDHQTTEQKQESMEWDYAHGKIDNIVANKKDIELVDAFKQETNGTETVPLKILMDGAPGVGKTTLTRKTCIDWANSEILQEYHLVILIPLREAKYRRATSIEDLIPGDSPKLKQEVIEHIQDTSGKDILLILDGFDELSTEERSLRQESLFLDIIKGDCLSECTVLVTSRPYASNSLQRIESVNRHVEVLGFTEKQISSCILQNISDKVKASELISKLHERLDIASICYIPLNCAIMMFVYQQKGYVLPNTLTELFSDFVFYSLKRHAIIVLQDEHLEKQLTGPKCPIPEVLAQQLSALSKLAYSGLIKDKLVFDYNDLLKHLAQVDGDLTPESCCLDLVTCTTSFTDEKTHYQFLHLSIQEYLAARYVFDNFPGEQQRQFFLNHLHDVRFRLMLLFLAGLTKLNVPSPEKIFENEKFKLGLVTRKFLYLAHLIFESQSNGLYTVLLHCLEDLERFRTIINELTLFDCMIIGHFLFSIDHSWKTLNLSSCSLTSHSIEVFKEVQCSYQDQHSNSSTFEIILLNRNKPDVLNSLPSFPFIWLSHAKELHCADLVVTEVGKPEVQSPGCDSTLILQPHFETQSTQDGSEELSQAYKKLLETNTTLRVLNLGGSSISDAIALGIAAGLIKNTSLEILDLDDCQSLTQSYHIAGIIPSAGRLVTNLSPRESPCVDLEEITLSDYVVTNVLSSANSSESLCQLHICSAHLSRVQSHCPWEVDVESTVFRNGRILQFFRALNSSVDTERCVHLPSNLDKSNTDITIKGAMSIFQLLELCTVWEKLDLSRNRQLAIEKDESEAVGYAISIERMLHSNTTLKVLDLHGGSANDTVVKAIADGLPNNSSVEEINLDDNTLSDNVASDLLSSANSSKALCRLHLSGGHFSRVHSQSVWKLDVNTWQKERIKWLLCVLERSSMSKNVQLPHKLDFSARCTTISSSSAVWLVSIFRLLEHSTSLEELDLSYRNLDTVDDSKEIGHALTRMLEANKTIKALMYNSSTLPDTCTIFDHILLGTSLKILELRNTGITSENAVIIFQLLESNTNLEKLDLSDNHHIADGGEPVSFAIKMMLETNTTLKILVLRDGSANDNVVRGIADGLPTNSSIEEIDLEDNTLSENVITDLLSSANSSNSLCRLNICRVDFSRVQSHGVWKMDLYYRGGLDDLGYSEQRVLSFLCVLLESSMSKNVQMPCKLYFGIYGAGHRCIFTQPLCPGITSSTALKTLSLSKTATTSQGAVTIFQSLESSTCLEELDLSWNDRLTVNFEAVGHAIERLLFYNKTLKSLSLTGCKLHPTVLIHLFKGLHNNTSLKELDISYPLSSLKGDGAIALAAMLRHNRSLAELTAQWCLWSLTDQSPCTVVQTPDCSEIKQVVESLLNNSSLRILRVSTPEKHLIETEIEIVQKRQNICSSQKLPFRVIGTFN